MQVQLAISNSINKNSIGPNGINIRHSKHLGPLATRYLRNMYNIAFYTNIIPHLCKHATIISIPNPNKNHNFGTYYQPIPLLSPIFKTLEKTLTKHNGKHSNHFSSIWIQTDMSKMFDIVNKHKLIQKLTLSNIPNIIIKFIANYIG